MILNAVIYSYIVKHIIVIDDVIDNNYIHYNRFIMSSPVVVA